MRTRLSLLALAAGAVVALAAAPAATAQVAVSGSIYGPHGAVTFHAPYAPTGSYCPPDRPYPSYYGHGSYRAYGYDAGYRPVYRSRWEPRRAHYRRYVPRWYPRRVIVRDCDSDGFYRR